MTALLVAHAAVTWFLTGLIWTIQVVHYPLFAGVGEERFSDYHREHATRIGRIVLLAMPLEAALAVALAVRPPAGVPAGAAWLGLALVVAIWGSTAFLQVPAHRALEQGFDRRPHRALVRTNVVRTAAWSTRALLAALFLVQTG